jgi:hypothetical protein
MPRTSSTHLRKPFAGIHSSIFLESISEESPGRSVGGLEATAVVVERGEGITGKLVGGGDAGGFWQLEKNMAAIIKGRTIDLDFTHTSTNRLPISSLF